MKKMKKHSRDNHTVCQQFAFLIHTGTMFAKQGGFIVLCFFAADATQCNKYKSQYSRPVHQYSTIQYTEALIRTAKE
jgi:hypothetical protein